ncbi:MAG: recombinase family protein, partial [Anaerolineae bacterium]|nr:recombinase family protein [Anaerolineae bacterium]
MNQIQTPAAIYVRVSSEEQTDGHSLDEQQLRCREFCQRRGYHIVAEYVEVESAKNIADRPQFQRMIADARAGRFRVIVCHKLDRFSRDVVDGLTVLKDLTQYGVAFTSASEEFDFTTPVGEMVLTLLLAFARWYRRNLIAETTKGKQGRARKGMTNASVLPFGYKRDESGQPVPSEDAPVVREMFERYSTGLFTDLQIAEWLNGLGKTTNGVWGKRPFSRDTVRAMLLNPFYAGWVVYRGLSDRENARRERMRQSKRAVKLIPGQHEPIISRELYERCQAIRGLRRRAAGRPAAGDRVYLLSRLAQCAHCGGLLRATRVGREEGYRCTTRERGLTCSAQRTHISQSALLPDLSAIMAQLQLPEGVKAEVLRILEASDPAAETSRKRERLEGELRRLNRMYQAGTVDDDYFDREAARIKAE